MVDVETLAGLEGLNTYEIIGNLLGVSVGTAMFLLIVISIWALVWKGLALWKSAQKKSIVWFIVLLIVNTVGILPILYIFIFSKMGKGKTKEAKDKPKKKK